MVVARITILKEHHRSRLEKRIKESSTAVWKAWSAQAEKLQTLRPIMKINKKRQGISQDGQEEHYYD